MEGLLIAIVVILGFYIGLGQTKDAVKGSTLAFAILCLARLFHGFNCRGNATVFGLGITSNIFSIVAFIIGFVLLSCVLLIDGLHKIFAISPIDSKDIALIYVFAFIPTIIIQIAKFIKYKK